MVYTLGETADGHPFIAMEYIEGQTLRHLLQTQPPTLKAALDIAIQIAAGAGAAHAIGIVHRDLKPENVIVRQDGLVKVLDFGLAKLSTGKVPADDSHATRTLVQTDAGVVMGTFTYMAPEQVRGQDADARADMWALGVILYELVAGRLPFRGETRSDVMAAILEREIVPLDQLNPALPHELQRMVAKALRKDRAQRYQTITDLRLDLEALRDELQASSLITAPPITAFAPPRTTTPPVRRESSAEYILTSLARHKIAAVVALIVIATLTAGARGGCAAAHPIVALAAPRAQRTLTRLTFGSGLQTDPTLSPDGRFLAYTSDRAGNFDIWVQPVAGGDAVQVTKDPESETQPAWSPDGSTIVFHSEKGGGGLFAVPALGGTARRLTAFGERPVWSRNGAEVLFQVGVSLNMGEGQLSVYSVAAEGGTPEQLAAPVLQRGTWKWVAEHPGRPAFRSRHARNTGEGLLHFLANWRALMKSNTSAVPSFPSRRARSIAFDSSGIALAPGSTSRRR